MMIIITVIRFCHYF